MFLFFSNDLEKAPCAAFLVGADTLRFLFLKDETWGMAFVGLALCESAFSYGLVY